MCFCEVFLAVVRICEAWLNAVIQNAFTLVDYADDNEADDGDKYSYFPDSSHYCCKSPEKSTIPAIYQSLALSPVIHGLLSVSRFK